MHNSPFAPMGSPRRTPEEPEPIQGFRFIEQQGDVIFYSDSKGKMFQKLGTNEMFKVSNGKITYRFIATKGKVTIKYENNGVHGFSLFKGKRLLEDNIWTFHDAIRIANEIQ